MLRSRILAFVVATLTGFCITALPNCDSVKVRITDALATCIRPNCTTDGVCADGGVAIDWESCAGLQCGQGAMNMTTETLTNVLTECEAENLTANKPDANFPDSARTCDGAFSILDNMHQCENKCTANCTDMLESFDERSIADIVAGFESCSQEDESGQIVAEVGDIPFVLRSIVHHVADVCYAQQNLTHAPTPAPQWSEDECYDRDHELRSFSGMLGFYLQSCDDAASLCKNDSKIGETVRKACLHTCDSCHLKPRSNSHGDECLGFTGDPLVCMHGDADGCWVHVNQRVCKKAI
jgi:hypothetical protein